MNALFLIPARGGSKGILHKNIKLLAGKPLIYYSIEIARKITADKNICVTTDDSDIIDLTEKIGLNVPFVRPYELSTDTATTSEVIRHALEHYESIGRHYDVTVLLQPTSPIRTPEQITEAMSLYDNGLDMVVSVKECRNSVTLFRENTNGYLEHVFDVSKGIRRQDAERMYEYNGSIYVINNQSIKTKDLPDFANNKKYVMTDLFSIDIDSMLDWYLCEAILEYKMNGKLQ